MVAPLRVNESLFHPDIIEITADVDGHPVPDRIRVDEPIPIRFRCPVPEGCEKTSPMQAILQVCHPSTYKGAATVVLIQQIQGGPQVSLTVGGSAGIRNITPLFPKKDENVYQFCTVLQGAGLDMKNKTGVPLEMHLWISTPGQPVKKSGKLGQDIHWVFRHAFEFVSEAQAK